MSDYKEFSQDNLTRFITSLVGDVPCTIEKAPSPLALVDLAGAKCVRTDRSATGYDLIEYQGRQGTFYMVLDRMNSHWAYVTFPDDD